MKEKDLKERIEKNFLSDKKIVKNTNVSLSFSKTSHAVERQKRHKRNITDKKIREVVDKTSKKLLENILKNNIHPKEEIVVKDHFSNLNLVGKIQKVSNEKYNLLIKTVMFCCDFKPKSGQKVIDNY